MKGRLEKAPLFHILTPMLSYGQSRSREILNLSAPMAYSTSYHGISPTQSVQVYMDGADHKPSSVPPAEGGDGHSSGTAVACRLKRHYPRTLDGPPSNVLLFGLAPDGVYQAFPVTRETGELLPRLFTLTRPGAGRYIFCGTFLRVAPSRR